jgi:hypothetical protein
MAAGAGYPLSDVVCNLDRKGLRRAHHPVVVTVPVG